MSTKTIDLIAYLLERVPSAGQTQIVQFLYLADLEGRKCLGKPLTDLHYVMCDHGPFDPKILEQLERMDAAGLVAVERYPYRGNLAYSYKKQKKTPKVHLSEEKEIVLDHVVELVRKNSLTALLKMVDETEPIVDARNRAAVGRPLKMTIVDNKRRIPGLEIERVLKSMKDLDDGKGRALEDIS